MSATLDFECLGYPGMDVEQVVDRALAEIAPLAVDGGRAARDGVGPATQGSAGIPEQGMPGLDSFATWALSHDGRTQLLRDLSFIGSVVFGVQPSQPLKVRH